MFVAERLYVKSLLVVQQQYLLKFSTDSAAFTQQDAQAVREVLQKRGLFKKMSKAAARQMQLLKSRLQTTEQARQLEPDVLEAFCELGTTLTSSVSLWWHSETTESRKDAAVEAMFKHLESSGRLSSSSHPPLLRGLPCAAGTTLRVLAHCTPCFLWCTPRALYAATKH